MRLGWEKLSGSELLENLNSYGVIVGKRSKLGVSFYNVPNKNYACLNLLFAVDCSLNNGVKLLEIMKF